MNWAGKAERLSFDVPTLPLFVHERLSTKAIVDTFVGHRKDKQADLWDLFGDPHHSITDQVLKAYEYPDKWVNRMILGDSLVVMNSLLQYEGPLALPLDSPGLSAGTPIRRRRSLASAGLIWPGSADYSRHSEKARSPRRHAIIRHLA